MPGAPINFAPFLVLAFVGWRVYVRCKRNIGRQPLRPKRMVLRICIYAVLLLLITVALLAMELRPLVFGGLFGGVGLGLVLGYFGLRLTRFETTPDGRFYTPNAYMGMGVSMLLVLRLVYRMIALSGDGDRALRQPPVMQSPLTMLFFGLLAGYYIAYYTGVLLHPPGKTPEV